MDSSDARLWEVRRVLHGKCNRRYKIYYCVRKLSPSSGTVIVIHLRHWARKGLSEDELQELMDDLLEDPGNGGQQ